ncbi:hypothetical protein C8R44DRAFT_754583 [Mycena epipterygia]|nr:hypothetical protein C8R44DRAFT_754583 [Mycena epipterygia]
MRTSLKRLRGRRSDTESEPEEVGERHTKGRGTLGQGKGRGDSASQNRREYIRKERAGEKRISCVLVEQVVDFIAKSYGTLQDTRRSKQDAGNWMLSEWTGSGRSREGAGEDGGRERELEGLGKGNLVTSAGSKKERPNCREGELEGKKVRATKWGRGRGGRGRAEGTAGEGPGEGGGRKRE